MNKDEKDLGKESETTQSIYGFLAKDWLKMILDKLVKVEAKDMNKDVLEEKKDEDHGREGS